MSSHYYYDPFNVQEEEEYFEIERQESHQQIQKWIQALLLSFTCQPRTYTTTTVNTTRTMNQDNDNHEDYNEQQQNAISSVLKTPWTSHYHGIMEIQLNLPLELQSLQDLVHAMMQPPPAPSTSTTTMTTRRNNNSRRYRLKLSHWGLPADQGIATLLPLLPQIVELSLNYCGITAQGFYILLLAIQQQVQQEWPYTTATTTTNDEDNQPHGIGNNNLHTLDLSHNPLLSMEGNPVQQQQQYSQSMIRFQTPKELLQHIFLHVLPSCTLPDDYSLKHLNLSSTGLYSQEVWDALWQGVQQSRVKSLLGSQTKTTTGSADMTILFQSVLPHLATLPLQSLILTRDTTAATDCSSSTTNMLRQLQTQLANNPCLLYFGPFSLSTQNILPRRFLYEDIHGFFLRRNRIRHCYLIIPQRRIELVPLSLPTTTQATSLPIIIPVTP